MDIVVGTTGHIDHGKTALIKALTGVDADRLPEEKQRGITIDLGFAELDLGDVRVGFVDVPGHERFVKNMLAGVSGIDLVLLVVAADEGVMPQTREHFEICRLLGVRSGLIVLTKRDLVDDETLDLARLDVAELVEGSFLEDAPVLAVSVKSNKGIDELRAALLAAAVIGQRRDDTHVARLPIDRSFSAKGFGTVVTGTLVSGEIREADELDIVPAGRKVRIRGLQTHGKKVSSVRAGQRTAANLAGVDHGEIERGMTLASSGTLRPTQMIDAEVEVLGDAVRGLRTRHRVRVHIGTTEALARVSVLNDAGEIAPGESDLVQFRFEVPVIAVPDDRFIIRSYSPQATIAGGRVIDNLARKYRKREMAVTRARLLRLKTAGNDHAERMSIYLEMAGRTGASFADLQARTGLRAELLQTAITENVKQGRIFDAVGHYVSTGPFQALEAEAVEILTDFHRQQPLAKGMPVEHLRERVFGYVSPVIAQSVLAKLSADGVIVAENETVRLGLHRTELSAEETTVTERLRSMYKNARYEVPRLDDALNEAAVGTKISLKDTRKLFQLLVEAGEIVKVTDEFYFTKKSIDALTDELRNFAATTSDKLIDVAKFKEITGLSRKYAIPLLEYFDRERVTRRAGDKRVIL